MITEEANHLKDMLDSLSLNSYKANFVEYIVSTHTHMFKGEGKKNQKLNHPKRQNKFSNKI